MPDKNMLRKLFADDALRYEHLHRVNPVAEKLAVEQRRALRRLRIQQGRERLENGHRLTQRWHDYERAGDALEQEIGRGIDRIEGEGSGAGFHGGSLT